MGKNARLERNFGITLADYRSMLEKQNYCCAICDKPNGTCAYSGETTKELSVDHDHVTGYVRGLLCNDCNRGIGQLGDSAARLRKAAEYLEHYSREHGRAALDSDLLLEELANSDHVIKP